MNYQELPGITRNYQDITRTYTATPLRLSPIFRTFLGYLESMLDDLATCRSRQVEAGRSRQVEVGRRQGRSRSRWKQVDHLAKIRLKIPVILISGRNYLELLGITRNYQDFSELLATFSDFLGRLPRSPLLTWGGSSNSRATVSNPGKHQSVDSNE